MQHCETALFRPPCLFYHCVCKFWAYVNLVKWTPGEKAIFKLKPVNKSSNNLYLPISKSFWWVNVPSSDSVDQRSDCTFYAV